MPGSERAQVREGVATTTHQNAEVCPCRHLTPRLTAARRSRGEAKVLYPDHRPSTEHSEADGAAVAVEPVVRANPMGRETMRRACHLEKTKYLERFQWRCEPQSARAYEAYLR